MIDSHSHIYLKDFDNDRETVIAEAISNGIEKILLPNIDSESIKNMLETEALFPEICFSMMGLHPTSVKNSYIRELETIEKELDKRDYIAIGEIGMDLYWDTTFATEQIEVLIKQLTWAKEKNLPVAIHTRNAFPEIFKVFDKVYDNRLKGVFHSFSGTLEDARLILQMPDFYLGINGTVTYKNSKLADILSVIGYEKLMLETDAPYLTPVPFRGKRNEPFYMIHTAKKLAEIYSVSVKTIDELTSINVKNLFKI